MASPRNMRVAYELIDKPDSEINGILNPFNKVNKLLTKNMVQNILKKYGVYQNISNMGLYQEAMIHESYTVPYINEVCSRDNVKVIKNPDGCVLLQPASYDRLEFLGDAVIENIIVSYLYQRYPDQPEGFLSMMKMNLVNRITLSQLAKVIGLNEYVILSKTLDDMQHAREDEKILCDVFEAFIGAIFIDFNGDKHGFLQSFMSGIGYQICELFVINLIEDERSGIDFTGFIMNDTNYKTSVLNYYKRVNHFTPQIKMVSIDQTRAGEKIIKVVITNPNTNEVLGEGMGKTQKHAEQDASKKCLMKLGLIGNTK